MNAKAEIEKIAAIPDLLSRALQLAGLLTRIFREAGWDLVVVGGAAVEFYTEGAYMSGDIDVCRTNLTPIPPRIAQDLIAQLDGTGGPRSWRVAGLYIDLLGLLENEAKSPCRKMETPYGEIAIAPAELMLVERILPAFYPRADAGALAIAKKFMAVCVSGATPVDWSEVERLAALPAFNILAETRALKREVAHALQSRKQAN